LGRRLTAQEKGGGVQGGEGLEGKVKGLTCGPRWRHIQGDKVAVPLSPKSEGRNQLKKWEGKKRQKRRGKRETQRRRSSAFRAVLMEHGGEITVQAEERSGEGIQKRDEKGAREKVYA